MRATRNGARLAIGVAAVLLMTACGDDDNDSASQATTTVAPTTSTTLSQIQLDKQKAQRVVLTGADVPGFTAKAPDTNPDDAELEAAANACVNNNPLVIRLGSTDDQRGTSSPQFSKGATLEVGSSMTFGDTEDQTRTAIADVSGTSYGSCFSKANAATIRKLPGVTNVTAATTKLPALTVGEQSIGYRTVTTFRAQGQTVTINSDFTFIRVGRGLAELDTHSSPAGFPEAERVRLATTLAARMAAP